MERKSGFYWVKFNENSDWCVFEYCAKYKIWISPGFDGSFDDKHIHEINPNRIMSPDEW